MHSKILVFFFCSLLIFAGTSLAKTEKIAEKKPEAPASATLSASAAIPTTAATPEDVSVSSDATFMNLSGISTEAFIIKKESFEEAGKELAKKADKMEKKLVPYFGRLVTDEIISGISYGKAGLTFLLFGFLFLLFKAMVFSLRKCLGETWPRKFDFDGFVAQSPNWLNPLLAALYRPLSLSFWVYGLFTLLTFLFQNRELEVWFIKTVFGQFVEITGFFSFFWALFRIIRIVEIRLQEWAKSTPTHWDNLLVPFIGKILKFIVPLLAFIFSLPFFHLSATFQSAFEKGLAILLISFFSWILTQLVLLVEKALLMEYGDKVSENLRARRIFTQAHILKRVLLFIISLLSFSSILMVFESVRQLGAGVLASAGVLGIIVGFAAQRTISTVLAGIQIVLTQPIRLEDVVIVEGEWGKVEEITLTYVVIRIWDLRRLVVPISYFLEKPFQNWTRTSNKILGTIFFYLDFTVPVEEMRKELKTIVEKSKNWDGDVCGVQVTDTKETIMEVRALISAEDSSKAWDLRCEIREQMITFLQKQYPQALPKIRVEMDALSPNPEVTK